MVASNGIMDAHSKIQRAVKEIGFIYNYTNLLLEKTMCSKLDLSIVAFSDLFPNSVVTDHIRNLHSTTNPSRWWYLFDVITYHTCPKGLQLM